MKVLIVGLGSMGKRRIRNLQSIGGAELGGVDLRDDRRGEVEETYHIRTFTTFDQALASFQPNAVVISTPPDLHIGYANHCIRNGIPSFMEASVAPPSDMIHLAHASTRAQVLCVPSCTLKFYPGPLTIKSLIGAGTIGEPLVITYHVGQYLKDWHPWEDVQDFYVSRPATGACRELVPFELTWLNDIFGKPGVRGAQVARLSDLVLEIDDAYQCLLEYPAGTVLSLTIEVLSRPGATREMRIVGSEGILTFSGETNLVRWKNLDSPEWNDIVLGLGTVEEGYINPEEPYIDEMRSFLESVRRDSADVFPNSLENDAEVLALLEQIEVAASNPRS